MKKITLLVLLAIVITVASYADFSANLTFTARLTGAQETPPVSTSAIGIASFILNETHDTMCVNVTVKGLSGAITGAHIHEGAIGVPGPVIIPLSNVNDYSITATLTGTDVSAANIAKFLNGDFYINVHTAANAGGEIRGQIMLESDHAYMANLDGAQEVPPVATNATGIVIVDLYRDMERSDIYAQFSGLSGPITGFRFYQGGPGVNGSLVASYDTSAANTIDIEVEDSIFLADLLAGNLYVNVLTAAHPSGEIRGQLMTANHLAFDMRLDGSQETPPNVSAANGLGMLTVSGTLDTLWYNIIFDGLSSPATSAHFHMAEEGTPGPVVVDISSSINGNHISGYVTGATVTSSFINNCLLGNIYVNIHNANYPNGEIRGQVERYAREGFTYTINAQQETPPTSSTATGSGFLSVDRELENAYFEAIVNGLSGSLQAAHFHNAVVGLPGPVIFPLTQLISPLSDSVSIFGEWTDEDIAAFDSSSVAMLFSNEVYINFHTVLNPAGEVRGQVIQGGDCFENIPSGVAYQNESSGEIIVYPVPSSNYVSITYDAHFSSDVRISVYDISGREMSTEKFPASAGENKIELDIAKLTSGIYLLKIESAGNQIYYRKLIKG